MVAEDIWVQHIAGMRCAEKRYFFAIHFTLSTVSWTLSALNWTILFFRYFGQVKGTVIRNQQWGAKILSSGRLSMHHVANAFSLSMNCS